MSMIRCFLFVLLLPVTLLCQDTSRTSIHDRPELGRFFAARSTVGTFLLVDLKADTGISYGRERLRDRDLPASTFKIFNTMAALDAEAIPDELTVLTWDGVDRGNEGWNRNQDMRTAFRNSTVWFYQELARRIGTVRMKEFIEREHYGNEDISGGIDRFWLDGALRISVDEQVTFLRRLYLHRLGFSERAQRVVNEIMLIERDSAGTLRGKTGWADEGTKQIGWFVGSIEKEGRVFLFAMKLVSMDAQFPMRRARAEILRGLLEDVGAGRWKL
jgi:beta-lactamase class D